MKRVLLIAATTGYQTQMFSEAAGRLGMELLLATDRCPSLDDPWGDQALAIRFEAPEKAALTIAGEGRIDGIVALGDRPSWVAAVVAEQLGMPYNPVDAVEACRNKFQARERFKGAGLPVPDFFRVRLSDGPAEAASRAPFPCVLKPLGLSGSRGVIRADSQEEFVAAFERIEAILSRPEILRVHEEQDQFIQVERFIPGVELALEGLMVDGSLRVLALFDKPDPLNGPYFEETIYVTPSRQPEEVQLAIRRATERAVQALGLRRGPIHAEMRVNSDGVWMLEVAARPIGGLCARVLPGLPEIILRHAVGDDVSDTAMVAGAAGVMMIPIPREGMYQDVRGVERALEIGGIEDIVITVKQGQRLVPLPDGNSYLGFIFARGESPVEVEAALRAAHGELRFEIMTALRVV